MTVVRILAYYIIFKSIGPVCFDPSLQKQTWQGRVAHLLHCSGMGTGKTIMNHEIKDDEAPFKMKDGVTAS